MKPQHPQSNPLVKFTVLTSFALLMTIFVAFRAGVFEPSFNASVLDITLEDPSNFFTNYTADSTPLIIPSSKSAAIFVPPTKKELRQAKKAHKKKTAKKRKEAKKQQNKKTLKKGPRISSSKSAAVFVPEGYKGNSTASSNNSIDY